MDIHSFFVGSSSRSPSTSDSRQSSSSEEDSDVESLEISASKKPRTTLPKERSKSSSRKYLKKWENDFSWLEYDEDCDGAFCKVCRRSGKTLLRTGGIWVTHPFTNWKKAVEKMKAHEKSDQHIQANLASEGALRAKSIVQQLQRVVDRQERAKNRAAIKSLIRCTHFLARNHIAHTTLRRIVNQP